MVGQVNVNRDSNLWAPAAVMTGLLGIMILRRTRSMNVTQPEIIEPPEQPEPGEGDVEIQVVYSILEPSGGA